MNIDYCRQIHLPAGLVLSATSEWSDLLAHCFSSNATVRCTESVYEASSAYPGRKAEAIHQPQVLLFRLDVSQGGTAQGPSSASCRSGLTTDSWAPLCPVRETGINQVFQG
jgi:hypothetical protein